MSRCQLQKIWKKQIDSKKINQSSLTTHVAPPGALQIPNLLQIAMLQHNVV